MATNPATLIKQQQEALMNRQQLSPYVEHDPRCIDDVHEIQDVLRNKPNWVISIRRRHLTPQEEANAIDSHLGSAICAFFICFFFYGLVSFFIS